MWLAGNHFNSYFILIIVLNINIKDISSSRMTRQVKSNAMIERDVIQQEVILYIYI